MASPTSKPMLALPHAVQHALAEPQLTALALANRDVDLIAYSLAERQLHRLGQLLQHDPLLASTGAAPAAVEALRRHLRAEAHQSNARRLANPLHAQQYHDHAAQFQHPDPSKPAVTGPLVPARPGRARRRPAAAAQPQQPTIDQLREVAARPRPDFGGHKAGDLSASARYERNQMRREWNAIKDARAAVAAHDKRMAPVLAQLTQLTEFSPGPLNPIEARRLARAGIERRQRMSWEERVAEDVSAIVRLGRPLPRASAHPLNHLPLWLRPDPWARLRS